MEQEFIVRRMNELESNQELTLSTLAEIQTKLDRIMRGVYGDVDNATHGIIRGHNDLVERVRQLEAQLSSSKIERDTVLVVLQKVFYFLGILSLVALSAKGVIEGDIFSLIR